MGPEQLPSGMLNPSPARVGWHRAQERRHRERCPGGVSVDAELLVAAQRSHAVRLTMDNAAHLRPM